MAAPKRLLWQLYPSYLVLVFISVAGATWYASSTLRDFFLDRIAADLESRAYLLAPQVHLLLDPLVDHTGELTRLREVSIGRL